MKSLRALRLKWRHTSPHKKGWIFSVSILLVIGIVLIAVGLGVLFGYFRPSEPWIYHHCYYRNVDYFPIDRNHEKFIYVVEGITYEKTLFAANRGTGVVFWYNANKPDEIIFAKEFFMVFLPIIIVIGFAFSVAGIVTYVKGRKKYKTDYYDN